MEILRLDFIGIVSQQEVFGLGELSGGSLAYAIILRDSVNQSRKLCITISDEQRQAIIPNDEIFIDAKHTPYHPFTELVKVFNIDVRQVIIDNITDGIFLSRIVCKQKNGETNTIQTLAINSIAIAIRMHIPIYIREEIMDVTCIEGLKLPSEYEEEVSGGADTEAEAVVDKVLEYHNLQSELERAVLHENYEEAGAIKSRLEELKRQLSEERGVDSSEAGDVVDSDAEESLGVDDLLLGREEELESNIISGVMENIDDLGESEEEERKSDVRGEDIVSSDGVEEEISVDTTEDASLGADDEDIVSEGVSDLGVEGAVEDESDEDLGGEEGGKTDKD